jgi:hypothetical protein
MKKRTHILILLLGFSISAFARLFHVWTEAEMRKASDLIVIGKVSQVEDIDETNTVLWPGYKFRGVKATFAVSQVLKGDFTNHTVVLHYYRFDPPHFSPINGPDFIELAAGDTNQFLLYLVPDGVSRFAPVSGQLDPAMDAVRVLHPK